jgi:LUD domain
MSTAQASDRFTSLPDDQALAATVVALEEHGFSVEVVDDRDAARAAVLARIPAGSSVMTNTSVTLDQTGIADAINDSGPYESARNKMLALDFATQAQQMKAIGGQPAPQSRAQAAPRLTAFLGACAGRRTPAAQSSRYQVSAGAAVGA